MPLLLLLLAIACGQGVPGARVESGTNEGGTSDGSACGNIAAEYHAAFAAALACDQASPNACTEWRPLTVAVVPNGGNTSMAQITGLCWVAYEGYVTQRGAATLDAINGATVRRGAPSRTVRLQRRTRPFARRTPRANLAAAERSHMYKPPLTRRTSPVTNAARSEARNAIASATSRGVPTRPKAAPSAIAFFAASGNTRVMSVSI